MNQQKLYSACESGDLKEVEQLHARGADMNVTLPDNNGWTPMCIACQNGHFEIVQWLHAHGAAMDTTRPNNDGENPMYIACHNGHFEIIQWLHAHGAAMDVTRPNNKGATPMIGPRVRKVISRSLNGSSHTVLTLTSCDQVGKERYQWTLHVKKDI